MFKMHERTTAVFATARQTRRLWVSQRRIDDSEHAIDADKQPSQYPF